MAAVPEPRHGPTMCTLPSLPAELLTLVFDRLKHNRNDIIRCALLCQALWEHAERYLWLVVPGLKLAHYGNGSGLNQLSTFTGTPKDDQRGIPESIGPMLCTKVLSLSLDIDDYHRHKSRIETNFRTLGTDYVAFSRNVKVLTVTPGTVFHRPTHFDRYISIIEQNHGTTLVYVPPLLKSSSISGEEDLRRSSLAAWIQQGANNPSGAPANGPDLFLESGTDTATIGRLFKEPGSYFGISFFGTADTDNSSVGQLCKSLGLSNMAPIRILRFHNIGTITYNSRFNLSVLETLEIHDCTDARFLLDAVASDTTTLKCLVIADSGALKKKPSKKRKPESKLSGSRLLEILRVNTNMVELCVCMGEITLITASKIIEVLPSKLKHLVLVHAKSDIFGPNNYRELALQCPQLRNLGITLFFAKQHDKRTSLSGANKQKIMDMMRGMGSMRNLHGIAVFRYEDLKDYTPLALASYLFEIGVKHIGALITLSIVRKDRSYTGNTPGPHGDHFQLDSAGKVVELTHQEMNQEMVTNLRFGSALFPRDMKEAAALSGIRYQFDGPDDKVTKLGHSEETYKTLQV